jgi:hypothetical protein
VRNNEDAKESKRRRRRRQRRRQGKTVFRQIYMHVNVFIVFEDTHDRSLMKQGCFLLVHERSIQSSSILSVVSDDATDCISISSVSALLLSSSSATSDKDFDHNCVDVDGSSTYSVIRIDGLFDEIEQLDVFDAAKFDLEYIN